MNTDTEFDILEKYMVFWIRCVTELQCIYHAYDGIKKSRMYQVPSFERFKEIIKERNYSEHYYEVDGRLVAQHMGAGYRDESALMRREYNYWNGVAFNFSEFEILGLPKLRLPCVHEVNKSHQIENQ